MLLKDKSYRHEERRGRRGKGERKEEENERERARDLCRFANLRSFLWQMTSGVTTQPVTLEPL